MEIHREPIHLYENELRFGWKYVLSGLGYWTLRLYDWSYLTRN